MTHPDTLQRAAFEAWANAAKLDTARCCKDSWGEATYLPHIDAMWAGWQAALQPQAAEPTKGDDELCFDDSEHLAAQAAAEPVNEWKEAVLDAVAAYSMDFRMDVPPCVIVNQLLGMAVTMAKDPAINKEAATYSTEAEGDAYTHGFFDGLREPFPTTPPATQAESPLLKDYVEKAVAAERRKWQAALTAALEALKEIASMEGTESNEWDGVERVIPEMCAVAKAAIAQLEALGVKHGSV